ncbi:MAG: transcription elongation factor GreA [Fimbriimonas sp.]
MNEAAILGDAQGTIPLTPDGYRRLQLELEHLTVVKRPDIADRIRDSQQHGEFSEDNSELDEVKFEQAIVESRIAELKAIFGNASVIDETRIPTDYVGVGSFVTVYDLEYADEFDVRVVTSVESDPNLDLLSNESPLGSAITGRKAGDEVVFEAPEGRKRYKILSIRR